MQLTWSVDRLGLRTPLRISRGATSFKDLVVLELEHDGLVGYGEAAATRYYRQPLDSLLAGLAELRSELSDLADPFAGLAWLDDLAMRRPDQPVLLAALDAAMHDWIGKQVWQPVHRLLGLPGGPFQTAFTLSISSPSEAAAAARVACSLGRRVLKLKVGLPTVEEDRALVAAVREAAPDASLYLDANGGWPPDEAPRRLAAVAAFRPALLEQPLAAGHLEELRAMRSTSDVPIFADEDALTAADVPRLWGVVDGINVKLTKCGGIRPALAMIHAARAAHLQVMLGCVVSSSLGMAPSVHLAGLADYLDLDGHLLLEHDPWEGLGSDTQLRLGGGPGLGIRPSTHCVRSTVCASPTD
jgi:L-alanine-DL-glutamate epimerase-like enolase superfamily enzyme